MANRLTAIIPCKNEQDLIGGCIERLQPVADEIIVADSGSTDRTLEIVRAIGGCRVIEREYVNPSDFKCWAISHARHPWVLLVDADEWAPPELQREIRDLLAGRPEHDGYRVGFRTIFLGRELRHSGVNTHKTTRLFRRDVCHCTEVRVHENIVVRSGKVGELRERFFHFTCRSLGHFLLKQARYAGWAAEDMHEKGKRVGPLGLLLRPPARFLQFYLLRGGVLDGTSGLILCMTAAFYNFMKYAKLWELQHAAEIRRSFDNPSNAPPSDPRVKAA